MVGQIVDAFKEQKPKLTVIKIWNRKELYIVLAAYSETEWKTEMDPYYTYVNGQIEGFSVMNNLPIADRVMTDNHLIYQRK